MALRIRRLALTLVMLATLAQPAALAADAPRSGWPEFRGPLGNGHAPAPKAADAPAVPLQWSETENVAWKTPIPFRGWSTPVVLEGKIWITTATEEGHDFYVLSVDAATGEILLNKQLFHADNPEPLGNNVNSYASPTAVVEPGRVYVHFGSYGTACLDTGSGEVLWQRQDLPCRHFRGPGASPILFENLLILTMDGADVQYVAALEKTTGETVWRTDRTTAWIDLDENGQPKREGDFRKAFTTPLVIDAAGKKQLISPSSYTIYSYDVRTGQEIWRGVHTSYSPASRPLFDGKLLFVPTGRGKSELWAIRPDGAGDVTATQVVWKLDGPAIPQEPSGILVDDLLYLVSNQGEATCVDTAMGAPLWSERLGGNYVASPVYAAGRLYFGSMQGKTTVLKPGRAYEILATNTLGGGLDDGFMASPAVVDDALYLRTRTHLYLIREGAKPAE
ncbi:MAG: PQQ-binding-like beta-propeller repeat protein [Candidatus Hydrogenedentes bacterium]|nr:PQQ-binding-like beta-propeller repeat protein [Candidatus Hydrogenedentota bacterium]